MDLGLTDRVYVVGGGSRGLGFATASALVAEGARVLLVARDQAVLDRAVATLGQSARGLVADLSDETAAHEVVAAGHAEFGRLDGGLVNVGGPPSGKADQLEDDAWEAAVRSTFLGPIRLARRLADDLRERSLDGQGAIAFVLSTSVRVPLPALSLSNAIRPGLAMHVKDLADAYGAPPRSIRVVGLLPSRIETERFAPAPEARPGLEAEVPLRRFGRAEEFGKVAAFALSPAASYVTGSLITVDGGLTRAL